MAALVVGFRMSPQNPFPAAIDDIIETVAKADLPGNTVFIGDSSGGGTLLPALTVLLTLYIAFFALSLLTGRSRIGISALTPRMMTLGLVLTFATSWVAYQSVVWNLAVGAPDQIAGVLTGSSGPATQLFADRIDILFAAVAEASEGAGSAPAGAAAQAGTFTPANLVWLAALLLMLGTVGVLVTARIALAVLLAIGPVFVVMVLFNGTRGLFAGWLRGVVMTSAAPLFAVVGGVPFPAVIEATFVRKDRYRFVAEPDTFPTPLDAPNFPHRADLYLGRLDHLGRVDR